MPPLARGVFESMHRFRGGIAVSGWMLEPDVPADAIRLLRDGVVAEEAPPNERPDLATAIPWVPHAASAGFLFVLQPRHPGERLTVQLLANGRELGRMTTVLRADLDDVPTPPPALMQRVTGLALPLIFQADGLRSCLDLCDALARHRPLDSIRELLDWGCGCGRIARHVRDLRLLRRVAGCDIDAEAVAYCQSALPEFEFTPISPEPPTPYAAGRFDAVLGYSVFTHLDAARQRAWIDELRRVLAPGGLIAVSVHGRFALRFVLPGAPANALDGGFLDGGEDDALAGIAPKGYYRGVFQTRAWTEAHWGHAFEVLESVEGGVQTFQDLVVLRRRA